MKGEGDVWRVRVVWKDKGDVWRVRVMCERVRVKCGG